MVLQDEITARLSDFKTLCKFHKVKRLYAFGSAVTGKFNPQTSDIDLIAEIDEDDPVVRGDTILSLWDSLEAFFHRKIDLITSMPVRNPFLRKNIEATKILIYDGIREKIFV